MSLEGDIQTLLAPLVSGRCYPLNAPDPVTKPYIVYSIVSEVTENTLDGDNGMSNSRVQVDAYGTSYGQVKGLAGKAGTIKAAMAGATTFSNIHLANRDLYENDTQLYHVAMDFSVWS
jgi:hypothetical protein